VTVESVDPTMMVGLHGAKHIGSERERWCKGANVSKRKKERRNASASDRMASIAARLFEMDRALAVRW